MSRRPASAGQRLVDGIMMINNTTKYLIRVLWCKLRNEDKNRDNELELVEARLSRLRTVTWAGQAMQLHLEPE